MTTEPITVRSLLRLWRSLSPANRLMVFSFAEFLKSRQPNDNEAVISEPVLIPRPTNESVIAALKRLRSSYPMLDMSELFNEASLLVSAHMMQGQSATTVIDSLETLFAQHYKKQYQPQEPS
jgi:hypothetical protein